MLKRRVTNKERLRRRKRRKLRRGCEGPKEYGFVSPFHPESGLVNWSHFHKNVSVFNTIKRAEAAGPSDCWTGEPDERLLRAMDKKLSRITEEKNALAEKAVEKGALFGMGLPGSPAEQKKSISTILENHLDTLDVNRRLRELRRWGKEEELGSPESAFWLMLVEEITKSTAASDATDSDVDLDARMASDDHLDVGL
ncbi:hypothetical protein Q3G72_012742 [Acer saccharum]|nr:hypothetical protein Q3G72_012742 [Acer saccharum]